MRVFGFNILSHKAVINYQFKLLINPRTAVSTFLFQSGCRETKDLFLFIRRLLQRDSDLKWQKGDTIDFSFLLGFISLVDDPQFFGGSLYN